MYVSTKLKQRFQEVASKWIYSTCSSHNETSCEANMLIPKSLICCNRFHFSNNAPGPYCTVSANRGKDVFWNSKERESIGGYLIKLVLCTNNIHSMKPTSLRQRSTGTRHKTFRREWSGEQVVHSWQTLTQELHVHVGQDQSSFSLSPNPYLATWYKTNLNVNF